MNDLELLTKMQRQLHQSAKSVLVARDCIVYIIIHYVTTWPNSLLEKT